MEDKLFKITYWYKEYNPLKEQFVDKPIHTIFVNDENDAKKIQEQFKGVYTKATYVEVIN